MIDREALGGTGPSLEAVASLLSRHVPLYRWRRPVYQAALLRSLRRLWEPQHKSVLDVGGGTGLMAQAIAALLPVDRVVSVDIGDRFLKGLDIQTRVFDGTTLPFADGSFGCVVMCNVLHHVPKPARRGLLLECGRVSESGVVYIKDHVAGGALDRLRLAALDLIGNLPFGGMVSASYLSREEWLETARDAGFTIAAWELETYRTGPMRRIFPNRLEVAMKLERTPARSA
jgi:SAM-dependent methyltransferase